MIYWELFLGFLKVGLFSFGGAYGAIPLIRDVVSSYGWMSDDMLSVMIAVSESTPGPIMVNMATYIGSQQAGVLGAVIATLTVIFPAFLIIILVDICLNRFLKNHYVHTVMEEGLKPCVIGVIIATGADLVIKNLLPSGESGPDWRVIVLSVILAAGYILPRYLGKKKSISPLWLILCSALLGILFFGAV